MSVGVDTVLRGPAFDVHRLVTGGAWRENCYLLVDCQTRAAAIIDPGDDADRVLRATSDLDCTVQHILLTHAHHDHVGAAADLSDALRIPARVHALDRPLLRMAPNYAIVFAKKKQRRVSIVEELNVDHRIELGATSVRVLETPGHSPGGVCFVAEVCIFTGDTMLERSIGRTDLPGSDRALLRESVDRLCEVLQPATVVCPGHGLTFTIGEFAEWWRQERNAEASGDIHPSEKASPGPTNR